MCRLIDPTHNSAQHNNKNLYSMWLQSNISYQSFISRNSYRNFFHLLRFRRQVFESLEENKKAFKTLIINHEDTNYKIFILKNNLICHLCKKQEHIPKNCTHQSTYAENTTQESHENAQ